MLAKVDKEFPSPPESKGQMQALAWTAGGMTSANSSERPALLCVLQHLSNKSACHEWTRFGVACLHVIRKRVLLRMYRTT